MTPIRIQRSRQHKQVSPNGLPIKYVGRPTKWGNPYRVVKEDDGRWHVIIHKKMVYRVLSKFITEKDAVEYCINRYQILIDCKIAVGILKLDELRGYNLSCWCPLDEPCHVDVLFELLNQGA